jgi:hypothetical protein
MPVFLVRFYKLRGEPRLKLRRSSERLALLVAKTPENMIGQLTGVRGQSGSNLLSQEVLNVFCQSNPHATTYLANSQEQPAVHARSLLPR